MHDKNNLIQTYGSPENNAKKISEKSTGGKKSFEKQRKSLSEVPRMPDVQAIKESR